MINPSSPEFWDPNNFLPLLSIRTKSHGIQPFKLWDHQRLLAAAVMQAYSQGKWLVHVKPRQEGSSTFFTGIAYQHAAFRSGCQVAIIGHKKQTAKSLAEIANRFYKSTPKQIRPHRQGRVLKSLQFPQIDSKLDVASCQDDEPLRGETVQVALGTEISSWAATGGDEVWASILNAVPENGGFFMAESTPKHHGDQLHMLCLDSEKPDSKWLKVFLPWTAVDEYQIKPPPKWIPSQQVREYWDTYTTLTPEQAYWMQVSGLPKCARNIQKFKQEYPINDFECWAMTGDAVFNQEKLRQMLESLDGGTGLAIEPDPWVKYEDPNPDHKYIIACDPAGSWSERDNFAVVILDLSTCEQVAEYLGHMSAYQMATNLAKWGRMYNDAMVYVEANGIGEAVLSHLIDNPNISYRKVFRRKPSRWGRSKQRIAGWWSSQKSKKEAEGQLQQMIDEESVLIRSPRSLRQLMNYRGQWGSKKDRDVFGGHYDLASAWSLAAWAYMQKRGAYWRYSIKQKEGKIAEDAVRRFIARLENRGMVEENNTPWGKHV